MQLMQQKHCFITYTSICQIGAAYMQPPAIHQKDCNPVVTQSLRKDSCACLKFDRVVVLLRPKCLVGISDVGLVLVAAYDGLHLTPHFHQLLRVPEDDFQ